MKARSKKITTKTTAKGVSRWKLAQQKQYAGFTTKVRNVRTEAAIDIYIGEVQKSRLLREQKKVLLRALMKKKASFSSRV